MQAQEQLDSPADRMTHEPKGHAYASTVISDPGVEVGEPDTGGWDDAFSARYTVRALLGEGGMGEVRLCKDARVGREVAMKVLHPGYSRSDLARRFVREARVQGQLEHPAIVPVYDLGRDQAGDAYFTMKRICGNTLEAIVDAQRRGNEYFLRQFSRRRLLTAWSNVCLAVHYAHSRGVVHRDLKPSNIMLCDFGEVYVLDWGIARVGGVALGAPPSPELEGANGKTGSGSVIGTPGYMAPEQIRGETETLDARTDVYALGAILFELLALEPLHRGKNPRELLASALQAPDARPSERAPARAIPPELDAVCVRATAPDPADRHASARELSEAIERFLDGDRDMERRHELAESYASAAILAGNAALESGDHATRERALAEAGRAIALDPTNVDALGILVRLIAHPPRELPDEAKKELEEVQGHHMRISASSATLMYASGLIFIPLAFLMGLPRGWWEYAMSGVWLSAAALTYWTSHRRKVSSWPLLLTFLLGAVGVTMAIPMFGPLIFVPTAATFLVTGNVVSAPRRMRGWLTALGGATVFVPMALELLGVVSPSYRFARGSAILAPRMLELQREWTFPFLAIATTTLVFMSGLFVWRLRNALDAAEERLVLQSWQLRRLVPKAAHGGMSSAPPAQISRCILTS
jgi:serine/threonine-protein kinase